MPVPSGTRITIRIPDDFHHHARDGPMTQTVIGHASERFGRCLIMPNLKPPITTTEQAIDYKNHIVKCTTATATATDASGSSSAGGTYASSFEPLMTLYLTDSTTAEEIYRAAKTNKAIVGCKYYPAGATTNSDYGVTDIKKCYNALQAMSDVGLVLCIHSEVTHGDIFDREKQFIEEIMKPLVTDFPQLKITMEHISTSDAVNYILNDSPDIVKASITCHHLLYNRNDLLVGGIKPHLYCLPILKASSHCLALCQAATSGNPKFFLGTDSAPHVTTAKESACGCAGIYTAHAAIELYLEVFDHYDALELFENFASTYGANHYGIPLSTQTITLEKKPWIVPTTYKISNDDHTTTTITPLRAGQEVQWQIVSRDT